MIIICMYCAKSLVLTALEARYRKYIATRYKQRLEVIELYYLVKTNTRVMRVVNDYSTSKTDATANHTH
jgi:hypothetical protein